MFTLIYASGIIEGSWNINRYQNQNPYYIRAMYWSVIFIVSSLLYYIAVGHINVIHAVMMWMTTKMVENAMLDRQYRNLHRDMAAMAEEKGMFKPRRD